MIIGIPKETHPGERRVALVPSMVARLVKQGFEVIVESGAGSTAHFSDEAYTEAGARLGDSAAALGADLVTRVQPPTDAEIAQMKPGAAVLGFLAPLDKPERIAALAERGVTAFAMELVPRITRAQRLDALSAMSAVGGYVAVLQSAASLPKFFPLLTTAAGTLRPAKVLVLGAGVAGLQAIATARRLGAEVSGYDIRPAAAEEVRSLGAKFVELELDTADSATAGGYAKQLDEDRQKRQIELLGEVIAVSDVVISTALIPGRPAPLLISETAVKNMAAGSVIIDMAAANGGNCALTEPGEIVVREGVTIHGPLNLPAEMPIHASQMYARTITAAIDELVADGALNLDMEDEIVVGCCCTHDGAVVHPRVAPLLETAAPAAAGAAG
jgi:NAD(P) transhydrogenase subunit alpha